MDSEFDLVFSILNSQFPILNSDLNHPPAQPLQIGLYLLVADDVGFEFLQPEI